MLVPEFAELVKLQAASAGNLLTNKYSQNSIAPGDYNSLFHGQGIEFDNVRPYIVGDDIRTINWRVTARTKKPHVKTFQAECDRKVLLMIDNNYYMHFGTRGTFKSIQAARAVALLSGMAFKNRDRVGGLVFGNIAEELAFFAPSRQQATIWRLFKLLTQQPVEQQYPIALAYALHQLQYNLATGTLVFLFTDVETIINTNLNLLATIKNKGDLILLPIIDPIDITLPALANITWLNNINNKLYLQQISSTMQDNYHQQWQANWQQLQIIIKKYQLRMIPLYTNQPVYHSLNAGLLKMRYY